MNVQVCGLAHAQFKLLITLLLGEMIAPVLVLTTINEVSNHVPFGKSAGSRYIVNCTWIFCSADPEASELLLTMKLIYHQLINK